MKDEDKTKEQLLEELDRLKEKYDVLLPAPDITGTKQTERALKESEELYRNLFENAPIGLGIVDDDGNLVAFNDAMLRPSGYCAEDIAASRHKAHLYYEPEDEARIKELLNRQGFLHNHESRFKRKDGEFFTALLSLTRVRYRGRPHWHAMIEDITERKRTEEELREREELYRSLIDTSPDAIILSDLDGKLLMISKRGADLYGSDDLDEIVGKNGFEFIAPGQRKNARLFVQNLLESGSIHNIEYKLARKDGTPFVAEISASVVPDKEGKPKYLLAVVTDITERKQMEEELLRAKKLESIGILAGGIAHDFNNILTAILGNISMARSQTGENDPLQERLTEAEKASILAKNLTQKLLTFSKGGDPVKKIASIGELIADSVCMALTGSNIRCDCSITSDPWPVEVDEDQMRQVLSNLIINASQSMPGGGSISVNAENIEVDSKSPLPLGEGRYVRISVEDQGTGIPQENLQKIFDPYFTTRTEGSGLGLATTYFIIKKHGGHITVESKVGAGTIFHIYLPAAQGRISSITKGRQELCAGKGRILVVDDEKMIRNVLRKMLEHLGYRAEFASSGEKAIELYIRAMECNAPFHAVILDLTIPCGMGGKETVGELLRIDPGVRAIASSGYSNDPVMSDHKNFGFKGVISKPYSIEELSNILHRTIN